ncbi:MAG: hypothetical protein LC723_05310 [Actinobacteria bacterium]|nr:hypothetical protein [Actinomycetota bacterium]
MNDTHWLAAYVSEQTGMEVTENQVRDMLRKLVSEGAIPERKTPTWQFYGDIDIRVKTLLARLKVRSTEPPLPDSLPVSPEPVQPMLPLWESSWNSSLGEEDDPLFEEPYTGAVEEDQG